MSFNSQTYLVVRGYFSYRVLRKCMVLLVPLATVHHHLVHLVVLRVHVLW